MSARRLLGRAVLLRGLALAGVLAVLWVAATPIGRNLAWAALRHTQRQYTVAERLQQYGPAARLRWQPFFEEAQVSYPPGRVVLAAFKSERRMEVYAAATRDGQLSHLRTLPIRGASGELGPKLRQGDRQVPEGMYDIESLNPNSRFHLSLRLAYPNTFDRAIGAREGRTNLGGDIMIHGSFVSSGCLAMGDEAAEDLFILVAETGLERVKTTLSPVDFRTTPYLVEATTSWVSELYDEIKRELQALPEGRGPG